MSSCRSVSIFACFCQSITRPMGASEMIIADHMTLLHTCSIPCVDSFFHFFHVVVVRRSHNTTSSAFAVRQVDDEEVSDHQHLLRSGTYNLARTIVVLVFCRGLDFLPRTSCSFLLPFELLFVTRFLFGIRRILCFPTRKTSE